MTILLQLLSLVGIKNTVFRFQEKTDWKGMRGGDDFDCIKRPKVYG